MWNHVLVENEKCSCCRKFEPGPHPLYRLNTNGFSGEHNQKIKNEYLNCAGFFLRPLIHEFKQFSANSAHNTDYLFPLKLYCQLLSSAFKTQFAVC